MKAYAMGWCLSALVGGTVLALGGGCGSDVVDFPTGSATAGTGGATAGTGVMTSGSTGTGGAGGAVTSGSSTTSGSSMTSGTSMTSGSTTSGSTATSSSTGGGVCDPAPGDTACSSCAKMTCCSDYNACVADANCVCWSGCLAQPGATPQSCFGTCGAPSATTQTFGQCVGGACQAECTGGGTTGSSAASSSASASTGTGGNACPPAPNDTMCAACAKQNCCSQVTSCAGDANCSCWIGCLAQNPGNNFLCFQTCGAPSAATSAIGQCTQQQCQGQCP